MFFFKYTSNVKLVVDVQNTIGLKVVLFIKHKIKISKLEISIKTTLILDK